MEVSEKMDRFTILEVHTIRSPSKLTVQPPGVRPPAAHSGRGPGPGPARPGRLQEGAGEGPRAPQVLRLCLLGRCRGRRLAPLLPLQELALSGQAELPG